MGLFQKIFGKQNIGAERAPSFQTFTAYQPAFTSWGGALYESELVRAAIDARARHISKLKLEINGAAQPMLTRKLRQNMNEWQTTGQFLYRLSTILDMQNTAFIVPIRGRYDEITGFYPVMPTLCTIVEYNGEPFLKYAFGNGQQAAVELTACGIMTKFQYRDDFFGEDNGALRSTLSLISIYEQGIENAVKNSTSYRFMAQISNFSNSKDLANERKRFSKENFSADAEAGGLLLFPNTYKDVKQISSTPYKVDADEMKLIQTNIYNYFGVNEDVLQNKAYGDAWQGFYEGAIETFAIQFSDVMTKCIYTARERSEGNLVMLTANRLQYMSTTEKLNVASSLMDRGVISINEARDIFNLAPVEGGDTRAIRGEYKSTEEIEGEEGNEE